MYIDTISIRNLRCFADAGTWFAHPESKLLEPDSLRNVTLLLGDNGAGKSTVLRAVALAILGRALPSIGGYSPFSLVRRVRGKKTRLGSAEASLMLSKEDQAGSVAIAGINLKALEDSRDEITKSRVTRKGEGNFTRSLKRGGERGLFLVGYGTRRFTERPDQYDRAGREKDRPTRIQRVASLLEEVGVFSLAPLERILGDLRRANAKRFLQVMELLEHLSPREGDHARVIVNMPGRGDSASLIRFRIDGTDLPFPALSDGFRSFYSWIGDLIFHLTHAVPTGDLSHARGIVLVDEVDLLLHPAWQSSVVSTLSRTFPRLQFIFTSHSALVAVGLHSSNIRLMHRKKNQAVEIRTPDVQTYGKSVDQILATAVFDRTPARAPEVEEALRSAIAGAREGDVKAAQKAMRLLAGDAR